MASKKIYTSLALVLMLVSGFFFEPGIQKYLMVDSISATVSMTLTPKSIAAPVILNPVSRVSAITYTLQVQSEYLASIYLNDSLVGVVNSEDGIIAVNVNLPNPLNIFTMKAVDYFGTPSAYIQFEINNGTSISDVSGAPQPKAESDSEAPVEDEVESEVEAEPEAELEPLDAPISTEPESVVVPETVVSDPLSADLSSLITFVPSQTSSNGTESSDADASISDTSITDSGEAGLETADGNYLLTAEEIAMDNLFEKGLDDGGIFTENKFQTFGHGPANVDVQIYLVTPEGLEIYIGTVKTDSRGNYFYTGAFPGPGIYQVFAKYLDGKGNAIVSHDKKTLSYKEIPPTPLDISGFAYFEANIFNAFLDNFYVLEEEQATLRGETLPNAQVSTYWNLSGRMIMVQTIADSSGAFSLKVPNGIEPGKNHTDAQAEDLSTRVFSKLTPVDFILAGDGFDSSPIYIYFKEFMFLYGYIIFYFIVLIIYYRRKNTWQWPEIIYLFSVYTILILFDEIREPINSFVYEYILIDILLLFLAYLLRRLFILKKSKYE